jgi:N-acetylmuramoyl-L-alanine amidase
LFDGRPFLHPLDLRKNFQPLLETPFHLDTNHAIVIDPGHGGTDAGAKSILNGHNEKEYTLDLARRLRSILVADGWTVWLTRTNDASMTLSNRVAFAERHKADLFISLHLNSASPDQEQAGLETYCLTPRGMPSNLTRGYADDASLAFRNNNFDADNLQLAFRLHRAVLKVNGHADRGVRRARFLGVLQGQNRPAILMEAGYLSNPREARRIDDPAYRQKIAEALAKALMEDSSDKANPAGKSAVSSAETNQPPASVAQSEKRGSEAGAR